MATLTTLQQTDTLANSRVPINNNFSVLNSAKVEGASSLTNVGKIVKVTAAGIVGESLFSESGTTVTLAGSLSVSGSITGNLTGNASTVTNGVYTSGSYADPAWITSLDKSKVGLGSVENTALSTWAGSANITTLGTVTAGSFPWANISGKPTAVSAFTNDAGYITSAALTWANIASKPTFASANTASAVVQRDSSGNFSAGTITASLSGNASTVTNGVYTTGSYADPSWITSLDKSKVGLGSVENTALSTWAGSANITTLAPALRYRTLGLTIDGGGSAITTGSKGYIYVPFNCTLDQWTILGDQTGSITIDVKRSTYSGFPTTSSIVGAGNKPTLSSAQKNQATPSGWTSTSLSAGDVIEFTVDSAATLTRASISLRVTV